MVRRQLVRGNYLENGAGRVPPGERRRELEHAPEDLRHDGSGTGYFSRYLSVCRASTTVMLGPPSPKY